MHKTSNYCFIKAHFKQRKLYFANGCTVLQWRALTPHSKKVPVLPACVVSVAPLATMDGWMDVGSQSIKSFKNKSLILNSCFGCQWREACPEQMRLL